MYGFRIKLSTKVDMSLSNDTKLKTIWTNWILFKLNARYQDKK